MRSLERNFARLVEERDLPAGDVVAEHLGDLVDDLVGIRRHQRPDLLRQLLDRISGPARLDQKAGGFNRFGLFHFYSPEDAMIAMAWRYHDVRRGRTRAALA